METFPFSHNDFLKLVNELIQKKDEFKCNKSAIDRTIIDKLYYVVFLHGRQWIEKNIPNNKLTYNGSDHNIVWDELKESSLIDFNTKYHLNSRLNNLRLYRNDATYVLEEKYLKTKNFKVSIQDLNLLYISDDVFTFMSILPI